MKKQSNKIASLASLLLILLAAPAFATGLVDDASEPEIVDVEITRAGEIRITRGGETELLREVGEEDWDRDWDEDWERDWDAEVEGDDWLPRERYHPRRDQGRILFRYHDDGYEQVCITGDFLDWEELPMHFDEVRGEWSIHVDLEAGRHHYRFTTEDEEGCWHAIDPGNSDVHKLPGHGWVSVIVLDPRGDVEEDDWGARRRVRRELQFRPGRSHLEYEDDTSVIIDYQRVDGLVLGIAPDHISQRDFEPSGEIRVNYGFRSEEWSAGLTVLQPLTTDNLMWLRIDGHAGTDFTEQTGIGGLENMLAAVFFKQDFRDYYRREGIAASLVLHAVPWLRVQGGIRSDDFCSLENTADWSFEDGEFLPNPPVDEGTLRSAFGRLRLGSRFNRIEVEYERSGEDLFGGDFDFEQVWGRYRGRLPMSPRTYFDFRVEAGSNLGGMLPIQRRYVLGGLGAVRGYPYQSLVIPADDAPGDADPGLPYGGEQMLLANLEYSFEFIGDLRLSLLYDAGMAWEDRTAEMDLEQLKHSAGLGFELGDGGLRVNVMKALDDGDRDPAVELRINRTF